MYVFKGIHFNSDAIPDPCDSDPCHNNGTCDGVSGNATCVCPPEYTGPTCASTIYDDSEEKASLSLTRSVFLDFDLGLTVFVANKECLPWS
jgi:hypothetical protein